MRPFAWPLILSALTSVGCAGTVAGADGAGDAEATITSAIVVVERTSDPGAAPRTQASARFIRVAGSSSTSDALRAIGAAADLPARDTCAPVSAPAGGVTLEEPAPVVELLDVGSVSLEPAGGAETRLVPRQLPDVTDVVSGVVYARAADSIVLPADARYVLHVGGRADLPGFDVAALAPDDPGDVRLGGEEVHSAGEDAGAPFVVTSASVDVTWKRDGTADLVFVDVQPAGVRCVLGDGLAEGPLAHGAFPASLMNDSGSILVHRLRREPLHIQGLDSGEIRFDFARSVQYVRR
jgi:hypothetical protein